MNDKEVNIASLAPEMATANSGRATPCHRVGKRLDVSKRERSFTSFEYGSNDTVKTLVDFVKTEMRTRKGEFMGNHFALTVLRSEIDDGRFDREKTLPMLSSSDLSTVGKYEFAYDLDGNGFYQHSRQADRVSLPSATPEGALKRMRTNAAATTNIGAENKNGSDLPPCCASQFFKQIYPLLTKLCVATGDSEMLELLATKPCYSEGVKLYRLTPKGKIIQVDDASATQSQTVLVETTLMYKDAEGHSDMSKNSERDNIKLMKVALRSKEYISRVLDLVPVPRGFFWVTLVCLLSTALAISMATALYAMYTSQMNRLRDEMEIMYVVPGQYKYAINAAVFLMQAVAVSE
ncbi:MAG: hypothetical protein P4M11_04485 [Candidatus Pacebacteria bacterium]|nr:hypothetical protein [Candidatus Paceibacterota bacterium]